MSTATCASTIRKQSTARCSDMLMRLRYRIALYRAAWAVYMCEHNGHRFKRCGITEHTFCTRPGCKFFKARWEA